MPVFRIAAVRTEFHLIEAVIRADSPDEAETKLYESLGNEDHDVVTWEEDSGGSDTEVESVELLPVDHDPRPSDDDRTLCLYCGRPFYWSGAPAHRSATGLTIPGPWLHVERPLISEGMGL